MAYTDLLAIAVRRSPGISQAQSEYRASQARADAAGQMRPLGLTLTAEYSKGADAAKPWLFGTSVDIPLDLAGQREARMAEARFVSLSAHFVMAAALWDVRSQLRAAITEVHAARQILVFSRDAYDLQRALADLEQRKFDAGETPVGSVIASQQMLDASRQDLQQQQVDLVNAQIQLAGVLNIPVEQARTLAVDNIPLPELDRETIADNEERSLYTHSEIFAAISAYDLAEARLKSEVAKQYPDIHLSPGIVWERGVFKWPLSVGFSLPPLDMNKANIGAAEQDRIAAAEKLDAAVDALGRNQRVAAETYFQQRQNYDLYNTLSVTLAAKELSNAKHLVASGYSSADTLLAAKYKYYQTLRTAAQKRADFLRASNALENTWNQSATTEENDQLSRILLDLENDL
ncbi:TolC family protein [Kordiimonas aestuarii]|uniref:TolC family protein n=1 Tax=Kordiimonas aestuarii TaxID=1005925 RepID=UPI0021D2CB4C|nr:TolC family protein [Kordiimonas aestuarii]